MKYDIDINALLEVVNRIAVMYRTARESARRVNNAQFSEPYKSELFTRYHAKAEAFSRCANILIEALHINPSEVGL